MSSPPPAVPPTPESRRRRGGCLLPILLAGLFLSLVLNCAGGLIVFEVIENPMEVDDDSDNISERFLLGDKDAKDKIAVVRMSGVINEGTIQYPIHQLEAAARDKHVKAVVLRIDSPGGTVTASEELYQNILNLRDNTDRRFKCSGPKPVSVSMGGLAASGAYYIAVPGKPIAAEPTTITGSIGVFAALPNIAGWAKEHKIKLELIKAGGIKASGSFFHDLTPQERETWQEVVDSAYDTFLGVIATNRPNLPAKELRDKIVIERMIPERDDKGNPKLDAAGKPIEVKYTRVLADGGTYTAAQAQKFGLVDKIEDLPATIRATATANGLGSFKAVVYDRPQGLVERLTGFNIKSRSPLPDLGDVSSALTPRLWYLAPSADAGLLTPAP